MNYRNILLNKINSKKAVVGIIGLGYVPDCLWHALTEKFQCSWF